MTAIREHLAAHGVQAEEITHAPTYSALSEAARLGVPPEEVAKTIVLDSRGAHALAVIPASERLDMRRVHKALDDPHARLASEEELRRDYPDFELGAFPPLGSLLRAPLYIDPRVVQRDTIVFAAGTADTSLRVRTQDLFRDENPTVTDLVREFDDEDKEPMEP